MNLYLLRHGLAADPLGPGAFADAERPLTPEGKRKLRKIARALKGVGIEFDLILTSPYTRALQTAQLVAKELKLTRKVRCAEELVPGAGLRRLIERIRSLKPMPADLVLVGHEPFLSQLLSLLITGDTGASVTLKKAGFAQLAVTKLRHGQCATLELLLTPGVMVKVKRGA